MLTWSASAWLEGWSYPEPPVVHTGAVEIAIGGDVIRLGQLLKFANVVSDGGEAKALLASGGVQVDGDIETRRGRQVPVGATVEISDGQQTITLHVVA